MEKIATMFSSSNAITWLSYLYVISDARTMCVVSEYINVPRICLLVNCRCMGYVVNGLDARFSQGENNYQ